MNVIRGMVSETNWPLGYEGHIGYVNVRDTYEEDIKCFEKLQDEGIIKLISHIKDNSLIEVKFKKIK